MALSRNSKIGLGLGGAFTVFVAGLTFYLNVNDRKVEVERVSLDGQDWYPVTPWASPPSVLVCDSAPTWVKEEVHGLVEELEKQGLAFGPVHVGACPLPCLYRTKDGQERRVACQEGAIVVDLRDHWFSETHAGETLLAFSETGKLKHATSLLPSDVTDDRTDGDLGKRMPRDAKRIVLAHELVHGLAYGHSFTPIFGPFISHKTGEMMNPELINMGWGFLGLP